MDVEVERKFKLTDDIYGEIKRRFQRVGRFRVEDAYYFSPELLPVTDFDSFAVRIRRQEGRSFLQLKGVKGEFLEMSTELDETTEEFMARFLPALGMHEIARVTKDREVFEGKGVWLMVDRVEGLGDFVEIESKHGELGDVEEAARAIRVEGDAEGTYLMALLDGTEWTRYFVR